MQLYDNAFDSNYEELKTFYPVWYRDVLEMDALWQAFGGQLDDIQAGIIQVIANCFVQTADANTIRRLEQFLYITYEGPRTLEERRTVVASFFYGHGHIGEQEIKEVVRAFTEGEISVNFNRGTIEISVVRDITEHFHICDCLYILKKRIPAHLGLGYHDIFLPIIFTTENRFLFRDFGVCVNFYNGNVGEPVRLDGQRRLDGTWTLDQIFWHFLMPRFGVGLHLRNHNRVSIPDSGMGTLASARNRMSHRMEDVQFRIRFSTGIYESPPLLDGQDYLDGTWLLGPAVQGPRFYSFGSQYSVRQRYSLGGSVTMDSRYTLDGSALLDGTRNLNPTIIKEEL